MELQNKTYQMIVNNKPSQLEQMRKVKFVAHKKSRFSALFMQRYSSQDGLMSPKRTHHKQENTDDDFVQKE